MKGKMRRPRMLTEEYKKVGEDLEIKLEVGAEEGKSQNWADEKNIKSQRIT